LKTPAPPPDFDDLFKQLASSDRVLTVLEATQASSPSQRYLPWDKLRYKTPPDGLTHDEWWVAIKLGRRSAQRPLDLLRDVGGRPFSYALPDEVLESVDAVTRAASGHITISEQVTNPATRDRYIISSLIEEAITSSQLEGASTSRRVAKEMIRSGRPAKNRSERMIVNNYRAMLRISELRDEQLTPDLICELHRVVTVDAIDDPDGAGKIQTDDADRIAVYSDDDELLHRPPPVSELPERMQRLCDFANGDDGGGYVPPVIRAMAVHFMVGYDHYFEDGNGRTARALFYWVMLRQGYWLTEFLAISRILKRAPSQYARSFLLTEQDDGDLTHFFIYHLDVILRAIRDLHEYLALKADELRRLQRTIKSRPGEYNHRELSLLEHAVRNPGATYSAQGHASVHLTSGETARQDLHHLEERGLLNRYKLGRRNVWSPAVDLAERLSD
jgi:Fic family protein